jgi:hypothetical protein
MEGGGSGQLKIAVSGRGRKGKDGVVPDEVLVDRMQRRNGIEIVHDALHKRMLRVLQRGERQHKRRDLKN